MQTFQTNLLPPLSDCHPKCRHTHIRLHDVTPQETHLLETLKSYPCYLVSEYLVLMHFQNVWRYGLINYVECEEVSVNGIPKLTTALKARQVSFLLLAVCA
jgi:hypothetical protein